MPSSAQPPRVAWFDERRQVAMILRDERQRPSGRAADRGREVRDDVHAAVVEQRMRRVETQSVEPVLAHPVDRVVDDEAADRRGSRAVQIDGAAPRRCAPVGDVLRVELRQVRAFGARDGCRPRRASRRGRARVRRRRRRGGRRAGRSCATARTGRRRRSPSCAGRGTRQPASARSPSRRGRAAPAVARVPRQRCRDRVNVPTCSS